MLLTAKFLLWSFMGIAALIDATPGPDIENCVLLMKR